MDHRRYIIYLLMLFVARIQNVLRPPSKEARPLSYARVSVLNLLYDHAKGNMRNVHVNPNIGDLINITVGFRRLFTQDNNNPIVWYKP